MVFLLSASGLPRRGAGQTSSPSTSTSTLFRFSFVQKNGQPDRRTTATMAEQQPTPPPSHNAPVIKIDDAIEAIGMGK